MLYHFLLVMTLLTADCDMSQIRADYNNTNKEEGLKYFLNTYESNPCPDYTPYIASAVMQQAQYAGGVTTKLKFFNQGKKMLEDYITLHPNDIESRYVRVLVQESIPIFLGYKKNIKADKNYVKKNLTDADLPAAFKSTIRKNLNL